MLDLRVKATRKIDLFLPQCLFMAWNLFMMFMVTRHFNYITYKNGQDILLKKIPFYIPQEFILVWNNLRLNDRIGIFGWAIPLYCKTKEPRSGYRVWSSVQGEGVTNEATTTHLQCNMRVPFGTRVAALRNKCKYLFLEMRVLLKITVYFKTMVPRVCHHNVAVWGQSQSLWAIQRVCGGVDIGQEGSTAVKHLESHRKVWWYEDVKPLSDMWSHC